MSRQWRFGLVMAVLGVLLASYLLRDRSTQANSPVTEHSQTNQSDTPASREPQQAAAPTPMAVSPAPAGDAEFKAWIKQEARQLDSLSVNTEAKQAELRTRVANLTPNQAGQLLQTARSKFATSGEKIISTYLLVEAGASARSELQKLIVAPVEDTGPHEAHSEGEMNGIRDKSLKIMGVDGLAAKAKTDPSAREALAKSIPDIQDPYVRSYAEERLKEISNQ